MLERRPAPCRGYCSWCLGNRDLSIATSTCEPGLTSHLLQLLKKPQPHRAGKRSESFEKFAHAVDVPALASLLPEALACPLPRIKIATDSPHCQRELPRTRANRRNQPRTSATHPRTACTPSTPRDPRANVSSSASFPRRDSTAAEQTTRPTSGFRITQVESRSARPAA